MNHSNNSEIIIFWKSNRPKQVYLQKLGVRTAKWTCSSKNLDFFQIFVLGACCYPCILPKVPLMRNGAIRTCRVILLKIYKKRVGEISIFLKRCSWVCWGRNGQLKVLQFVTDIFSLVFISFISLKLSKRVLYKN